MDQAGKQWKQMSFTSIIPYPCLEHSGAVVFVSALDFSSCTPLFPFTANLSSLFQYDFTLHTTLGPVMQWQPLVKIHAGVPVEHSCGRHKSAVGTSHAKVATPTGNSYGKAYHILFHQQRCSTPTQWQPVVNIHGDPPNNLTEA